TDEAGNPLKDARVLISINSWDKSVRAGPDGKFEMKGVHQTHQFDFHVAGFTTLRGQALSRTEENRVVLQAEGALKCGVVDRDGKPIRDFRVLLAFTKNRQAGDRTEGYFAGYSGIGVRFTSPDGSFVLTGVGAGSVYRVRVIAEGHGEAVQGPGARGPARRP